MKTKQIIFKSILVFTCSALVLTGCRKKEDEDNDTTGSSDNALAERTYSDVQNISDEASEANSLSSYKVGAGDGLLSTCATVTRDTVTIPHLITIDFGTSNCPCSDGRNRRGKILVSYSGKYKDSLSTHTITFSNYFVNDNGVSGTKTVTNMGHIAAGGNLQWNVSVTGSIVLANGGGTISWSSNRVRVMTAGESTSGILGWSDDVYSITGSASGTSAKGNAFTANITSALIKKMNCRHIVQGTFDFNPGNGKPIRTVDYGNGVCDDVATVTINGKTYTIQLR